MVVLIALIYFMSGDVSSDRVNFIMPNHSAVDPLRSGSMAFFLIYHTDGIMESLKETVPSYLPLTENGFDLYGQIFMCDN